MNLFQIWKIYQRRADSLAHYFDTQIEYYHYHWEEKNKLTKAASYALKSINTIKDLFKYKPSLIFIQLPPTPILYIVGVYCIFTKTRYVADCHNAMFYRWWIKWPFAKLLLRRASAVLVHNNDVQTHAATMDIDTVVIRDPLPQRKNIPDSDMLTTFGLTKHQYVIVPWNMQADEPIAEFIEAVRKLPNIKFAMTWFAERLPVSLSSNLPDNLILTGYLDIDKFNELFYHAGAAISLTTSKGIQPSAAAEAIAFGTPIILSNNATAITLYRDVPIYVENTPESIANGVSTLFSKQEHYRVRVKEFKDTLNKILEEEVAKLSKLIQEQ